MVYILILSPIYFFFTPSASITRVNLSFLPLLYYYFCLLFWLRPQDSVQSVFLSLRKRCLYIRNLNFFFSSNWGKGFDWVQLLINKLCRFILGEHFLAEANNFQKYYRRALYPNRPLPIVMNQDFFVSLG